MLPARSLIVSPLLWRWLLALYWTALFIGTHIPPQIPSLAPGTLDKFAHLGAYAGLAVLFTINWQMFGGHLTLRHYLATVFVLAVYGAVDEQLQNFVHRDCSLADWVADVVGATLGVALFHYGRGRMRKIGPGVGQRRDADDQ